MKKIYKNPTLTVVNVRPMQMIATSQLGVTNRTLNADQSLGRQSRFSDWEDDEE